MNKKHHISSHVHCISGHVMKLVTETDGLGNKFKFWKCPIDGMSKEWHWCHKDLEG